MAIPYGTQLFESNSTVITNRLNLGSTIPAGTLIAIGLGGRRSGSLLDIAAITDSKGHTWRRKVFASTFRCAGVAVCRTSQSMNTSDWVQVKWNGTPSFCWITGHSFSNASGIPTDSSQNFGGPASTGSATVNVAGPEYLVLTTLNLAYDWSVTTTPLNSMTKRDTFSASPQQIEFMSRNTSGGSTFQGGASLSPSVYFAAVSMSLRFEAPSAPPPPPAGTSVAVGGVLGV